MEVNGKQVMVTDVDIQKDFASINTVASGRLIKCGAHVHHWLAENDSRKGKDFAKVHGVTETETSQAHQCYQASLVLPWLCECTANQAKVWARAIVNGKGGKDAKPVTKADVIFKDK